LTDSQHHESLQTSPEQKVEEKSKAWSDGNAQADWWLSASDANRMQGQGVQEEPRNSGASHAEAGFQREPRAGRTSQGNCLQAREGGAAGSRTVARPKRKKPSQQA
jgi:hypothetical protein